MRLSTEEIKHDLLGTIAIGTTSIEYYWLDRWYNIFRFAQPTGELRSYYCKSTSRRNFDGQILSYIDLDIDILVEPDISYRMLDLEDFEAKRCSVTVIPQRFKRMRAQATEGTG